MPRIPRISEAEWAVMDVIWRNSPLTAQDVVDKLAEPRDWSPRTVKTMLNRLVKKKALRFERQGRVYSYYAIVSREVCVAAQSASFLNRVFSGSVAPLMAHFVEHHRLSKKDIEELKRILEQREK